MRLLPALAWMGLIFYFSSLETLPEPPGFPLDLQAIAGHFIAYGVLAALFLWGLPSSLAGDRRRIILAFVLAVAYGVSDEIHQSFVPGRHTTVYDLIVDALGAAAALWIAARGGIVSRLLRADPSPPAAGSAAPDR